MKNVTTEKDDDVERDDKRQGDLHPQDPTEKEALTIEDEALTNYERPTLSEAQLELLMSPIHEARVKHLAAKGGLSYVNAHDIRATLIRVFGFLNFNIEVLEAEILQVLQGPGHVNKDGSPKTPQAIAKARVRLTIREPWAEYTEAACDNSSGWDIGEICDNAIKSAASSALKRCAINLGSQFGLSLYEDGSTTEIVKVIYEPKQAAVLARIRQRQATQRDTSNDGHIEAALGGERVQA